MDTQIADRKKQLSQEIKLAQSHLQDNIENLEPSKYISNPFDLNNLTASLLSASKLSTSSSILSFVDENFAIISMLINRIWKSRA